MRFSLFTTAVAAFAIAGSRAVKLTLDDPASIIPLEAVQTFQKPEAATVAATGVPVMSQRPESNDLPTKSTLPIPDEDKELDRAAVAQTVDSIRRGILALREVKAHSPEFE